MDNIFDFMRRISTVNGSEADLYTNLINLPLMLLESSKPVNKRATIGKVKDMFQKHSIFF